MLTFYAVPTPSPSVGAARNAALDLAVIRELLRDIDAIARIKQIQARPGHALAVLGRINAWSSQAITELEEASEA